MTHWLIRGHASRPKSNFSLVSSRIYPDVRDSWVLSTIRRRSRMWLEWENKQVFPSILCLRMGDRVSLRSKSCSIMNRVSRWCSGPVGLLNSRTHTRPEEKHMLNIKHTLAWPHTCAQMHNFAAQLEKWGAPGRPGTTAVSEHIERGIFS